MDVGSLRRDTTNHDMTVTSLERVVMDVRPITGDVSAVTPVAPPMYVEMMAGSMRADEVPGRFVPGTR